MRYASVRSPRALCFPECGFTPTPIDARCVRARGGAAVETSAIIDASRRGPCGYRAMSAMLCSFRKVPDFLACDATTMVRPSCSVDAAFVVVSACALSSWSPAPDAELL